MTKKTELEKLTKTTPEQLWETDLVKFEESLSEFEAILEKDREEEEAARLKQQGKKKTKKKKEDQEEESYCCSGGSTCCDAETCCCCDSDRCGREEGGS